MRDDFKVIFNGEITTAWQSNNTHEHGYFTECRRHNQTKAKLAKSSPAQVVPVYSWPCVLATRKEGVCRYFAAASPREWTCSLE